MSLPTVSSSNVVANCPKYDCICSEEPPPYGKINDSSIKCTYKTYLPAFIINASIDFPLPTRKCTKLILLGKHESTQFRKLYMLSTYHVIFL